MARNFFSDKKRPVYLSACLIKDCDIELVRAFEVVCQTQGISKQQGILRAVRAYLGREE